MTPRQHNATMIDLGGRRGILASSRQIGPLNQRTAASRTPIRHGLFGQHGPAMTANLFHSKILPD